MTGWLYVCMYVLADTTCSVCSTLHRPAVLALTLHVDLLLDLHVGTPPL